jgi:hypothetical protein
MATRIDSAIKKDDGSDAGSNEGEDSVADKQKQSLWKRYWVKCSQYFRKKPPKPKRNWRKEKENSESDDEDTEKGSEPDSDAVVSEDKKPKTALQKQEEFEAFQNVVAVRLQCLVRRFLARVNKRQRLQVAVAAAELAAGNKVLEYESRKRAKLENRAARVAHEQFSRFYVSDLLSGTSMFIVQTVAVTTIQKNWRGHKVRKRIYLAWVKANAPPKKAAKRYVPTVARRVWARKEFVPEGGWPAKKWSVIEYDINEYVDSAPKGRDFGLKTRKVLLPAKAQHIKDIVTNDTNAWVGIPINIEPVAVINRRAVLRKQELALLEGVSPYVGPQFKAIDIKPPVPLQGVAAIKALGWTPQMIDRRPLPPAGKRAYQVIDPYSNASLAADLATVAIPGQGFDGANETASHAYLSRLPLGSSLEQRSIGSISNGSFANKNSHSQSSKVGVGIGVWKGGTSDHSTVPIPGQTLSIGYKREPEESLLTHTSGSVIQLVTPIRGSLKPLSSKHRTALKQAKLLPEDLEEDYALQQIRDAGGIDAGNNRKARERRRVRAEKAAEIVAMHDPNKWTQTVGGRLRLQASNLADEIRTQRAPLQLVDDDPWSRSTFIQPKELPSKVLVWPKQPKQFYKVKYSWLPQTIVQEAAISVYSDLRKEQGKTQSGTSKGFPKAVKKPIPK